MNVGNVLFFDRHVQCKGGAFHCEPLAGDETVAPQSNNPLGWEEGSLHQYLGSITGRVILAVGNELHIFPLQVTSGRTLAAAYPTGQFGPVAPACGVCDGRGDAILAAQVRVKGTHSEFMFGVIRPGRGGRRDIAFLRHCLDLLPPAFAILPIEPGCPHDRAVPFDCIAVDIGDDDINRQRLALLNKVTGCAQTDVAVSGMQQQTGATAPRLPVHVQHRCRGVDVYREWSRSPLVSHFKSVI